METVHALQTHPETVGHNELGRKILFAKPPRRPIEPNMDAKDKSSVQQKQSTQPSPTSEKGSGQSPKNSKRGAEAEEKDGCAKTSSKTVSFNKSSVSFDFNGMMSMAKNNMKCYTKEDQLMESESSIFNKNKTITQNIDAFNWLDDWDVTIFRCQTCRRPFPTTETLKQHTTDHHSIYHLTEEMDKLSLPYFRGIPDDEMVWKDQTEVICEGGDLLLRVQEHRIRRISDLPMHTYFLEQVKYFQVSSAVLANASPVFNGMFGANSGFQEKLMVARGGVTGNPPAVITLIDDDPQVLRIILLVLHWKMDILPEKVDFEECVKLAVLADKYQLQKPLKVFVDRWVEKIGLEDKTKDEHDSIHQDWLLLAWVFNYPKQFARVTQQLIKRCLVRNGELWVKQGNDEKPTFVRLHPNVPEFVKAKLAEKRLMLIDRIRTYIANEKIRRSTISSALLCKGPIRNRKCDLLQNNHYLTAITLNFLDSEYFWSKSLVTINTQLNRLKPLKMSLALGATTSLTCAPCSFPTPELLAIAITQNLPQCCIRCREAEILRRRNQKEHSCIKNHEVPCSWLPGLLWAAKCAFRAEEQLNLADFRQGGEREGYLDRPPVRTEKNSLGHKRRVRCEDDAE